MSMRNASTTAGFLTVASGGTDTDTIDSKYLEDATMVFVHAPAGAPAGTFQISADNGVSWQTLQNTSGDIASPAGGKVLPLIELGCFYGLLRIHFGAATGAQYVFRLTKSFVS